MSFPNGYKGAQSASEVTLALGLGSWLLWPWDVTLGQSLEPVALGQDSTHFCFSGWCLGNSLSVLDTSIHALRLLSPWDSSPHFLGSVFWGA